MIKWLEDMSDKFKDWIISNGKEPILWVGLFVLGLLIFMITYKALNKNKG